jgi:hypothetical protein
LAPQLSGKAHLAETKPAAAKVKFIIFCPTAGLANARFVLICPDLNRHYSIRFGTVPAGSGHCARAPDLVEHRFQIFSPGWKNS